MTMRDRADEQEMLDDIRRRVEEARPDQLSALLRDLKDALPEPTHHSDVLH